MTPAARPAASIRRPRRLSMGGRRRVEGQRLCPPGGMHEEQITLGTREQRRALVLTRVVAGDWTPGPAALALGRSERQVRRLVAAVRAGGPAALVHGNRGRTVGAACRGRLGDDGAAAGRGPPRCPPPAPGGGRLIPAVAAPEGTLRAPAWLG
jgi:hypothetical protein